MRGHTRITPDLVRCICGRIVRIRKDGRIAKHKGGSTRNYSYQGRKSRCSQSEKQPAK